MHCNLNKFRHITILQILPKDGDLGELINLRPMALLLIFSNSMYDKNIMLDANAT